MWKGLGKRVQERGFMEMRGGIFDERHVKWTETYVTVCLITL